MKTKLSGILTLLLVCFVHLTFAQEKTVTGTVSDNSGLPLPGVNVIVQGTTTGTQTDFDGNYSINTSQGAVLVFSYVGLRSQSVTVGASDTLNVTMEEDAALLDEVIVTAQGIEREQKSLGYSVSQVESEDLEQKAQSDLGRVLQGKAAGVNITATNGVSGSGTNIIIRGYTSASFSNQPLFIVDGVPFDGGANQQSAFFDGTTESSRFLDLDPNNIEEVNVLKGLSATVLYGDRGKNGVILITTKNGSSKSANKKFEATITQSYFLSDAILPDYQTEFGGGFHQNFGFFFSNWGPSFDRDISSNTSFRGFDDDGTTLTEHPFNRLADPTLRNAFPDIRDSFYRYQNYNSVEEFFRQGSVASTSINLRGTNEDMSYNINYGRTEDEGFTPGNELTRNSLGFGGSARLANKFTIQGGLTYTNTDYKTPPVAASAGSGTVGDGSSVFGDVLYTPKNIDLFGIPFQTADGRSIYYRSGNDIQNPRWTVANAKTTQDVERINGNASLSYELSENSSITYQAGIDTYTEINTYGQNKGGVDGDPTGIFRTTNVRNKIWNHNLTYNINTDFTQDLNLNLAIGATSRRDTFEQDGAESTQQLAFGTLRHFNFVNHSTVNSFTGNEIAFFAEENRFGVYADATLGYKDFLYLNAAVRNDWSSTLETGNEQQLYPGVSLSFIPTAAFPGLKSDGYGLNYLKLRVGYGASAGFPSAYSTRNSLALTSRAFVNQGGAVLSTNSVSNRLGNPDLTPELVNEIEVGFESFFLKNRLGLNVSLFKKNTSDLIFDQNLDNSTGFTVTRINAGELEVQGIEVDYNITPLRNDNFKWRIDGNFYADESEVISLPEGTDELILTSSIGGRPANYLIPGKPYGIFQGLAISTDDQGNRIVDSDGFYQVDNDISILGDPNPDWTSSLTNTFTYKAWNFSFNFQYRHGGEIFSQTAATLIGRGVVDVGRPRRATYVLPGVKASDGTPNDIQITATNVGFDVQGFGANELQIFDGTTIRLNEVSLGYNLPTRYLDNTPFGSISLTVSGNNLWYDAVNFPDEVRFDTNTLSTGVGNGQGIDYITGPSSRRYGFSVKATF